MTPKCPDCGEAIEVRDEVIRGGVWWEIEACSACGSLMSAMPQVPVYPEWVDFFTLNVHAMYREARAS